MIAWKFKLWRTAGAAAALGLAACGGEGGETGKAGEGGEAAAVGEAGEAVAPASGEAGEAAIGESGGEQGEAGISSVYAGVTGDQRTALRLQHLKGFLLAAELVNQAGAATDAALLVQQGLLEVHTPAADQFGALDIARVRGAYDGATLSRSEMSERLRAGEHAIDQARPDDIDYATLSVRMIDISTGLYQNVVQPDFVDPIEYRHSLGAALAARDALAAGRSSLRGRDARAYDEAKTEIDRFVALWTSTDPPEHPPAYRDLLAQSSRVRLALSPFL